MEFIVSNQQPKLDERAVKHRVGLVALSTDHTTELDFARILSPAGIGVYVSRIPFTNPVTPETLRAMEPDLAYGAALILPGEVLDAIVYSCTSASVCMGDDVVRAHLISAKPGCPAITPISATLAGLRALQAKRISVLTPYTPETARPMAALFESAGFEINRFTCLNMTDDRDMARLSPDHLIELAQGAAAKQSDALFISCTAVRAAGLIGHIEATINKPTVSSNYATAWNVARICGESEALAPGRLMQLALPT